MKKNYLLTFLFGLFFLQLSAQFTMNDVKFWYGSGSDSAVLVVDFRDGSEDSSYAWGYLFNEADNKTMRNMLTDLTVAEPNFSIDNSGDFLNDAIFNSHAGLAAEPDWWSTWAGDAADNFGMNGGIGSTLQRNGWYGISYGFSPEPVAPGIPIPAYSSLWFNENQIDYWVGTGSKSAVLIVDFVQDNQDQPVVSYAFGVKFENSITGKEMLEAVAENNPNFTVNMTQFLNDISYNGLTGTGGNPGYWNTFSGTDLSNWLYNEGISTVVNDGEWFGTSYGEYPVRRPFIPTVAQDPNGFTVEDVLYWTGSGRDTAVIVVDFNDGATPHSYAFGYLFDNTATAKDALLALNASLPSFNADMGSYLNDITYLSHSGIGGTNGFYWSTWSARNNGGWVMNAGISASLTNGSWFGASYTDFMPALHPSTPVSAPSNLSVATIDNNKFSVYPNPFNDLITVKGGNGKVTVSDLTGKMLYTIEMTEQVSIDLTELQHGVYIITIESGNMISTQKIQK